MNYIKIFIILKNVVSITTFFESFSFELLFHFKEEKMQEHQQILKEPLHNNNIITQENKMNVIMTAI